MSESVLVEVIKQGGFAVLCGAMFLFYRNDSKAWAQKQSETAAAFMQFGERAATALTQVGEGLRQQSLILEEIERHLTRSRMCPLSSVTTALMREAAVAPEGGRRRVDALLHAAVQGIESAEPPVKRSAYEAARRDQPHEGR